MRPHRTRRRPDPRRVAPAGPATDDQEPPHRNIEPPARPRDEGTVPRPLTGLDAFGTSETDLVWSQNGHRTLRTGRYSASQGSTPDAANPHEHWSRRTRWTG